GNGGKTWSYAFAIPADGSYTVRAQGTQQSATTVNSSINTFTIDSVAPTLTSVTGPANGNYGTGQFLAFTVNYNENVTVTGTPNIGLTIGANSRTATYLSGSGTSALVFRYTVVAGDLDTDGIVSVSPINLN